MKRKVLNNNAIGILLLINVVLLTINIITMFGTNKDLNEVAYASESSELLEVDEKRKNDDDESVDEETFAFTYNIQSISLSSQNIDGIPMYFSHSDSKGAYFTYMKTDQPKEWKDGYWFASHDVMKQGNYDINLLTHNDELRTVYVADGNGGQDYMQLKPSNEIEDGYAYQ